MTVSASVHPTASDAAVDNTLCFVGTYTNYAVLPHWPRGHEEGEGIYVFRWNHGKLHLLHTVPLLNPAFMKYHPKLNVLYALSECIDQLGYITAFKVDHLTGDLKELGSLAVTGRSTCYISFDKDAKHAVVSNYWDAKLNVVELDSEGCPVRVVQELQQTNRKEYRQVVSREDHMANRQDGPHAHCDVFHPSYNWMFVPDLGDNCIYQYGYKEGKLQQQGHVSLEKGVGPRHFVFHPRLPVAYSGCELLGSVQVFAVDDTEPEVERLRVTPLQRLTTLPASFEALNYVGEIKIDHEGKFVYVSNRGHNSIAVFRVDQTNGLLAPVSIDCTGGKTPRHFGLSPCGSFLVAADQDSDIIKVFNVDRENGSLAYTGTEIPLPTPNFVLFQQPHLVAA